MSRLFEHPAYAVYVLRSQSDGLLYTGFTADLPRRFLEHQNGESPATAPRRPFELIYCEPFARRRRRSRARPPIRPNAEVAGSGTCHRKSS